MSNSNLEKRQCRQNVRQNEVEKRPQLPEVISRNSWVLTSKKSIDFGKQKKTMHEESPVKIILPPLVLLYYILISSMSLQSIFFNRWSFVPELVLVAMSEYHPHLSSSSILAGKCGNWSVPLRRLANHYAWPLHRSAQREEMVSR